MHVDTNYMRVLTALAFAFLLLGAAPVSSAHAQKTFVVNSVGDSSDDSSDGDCDTGDTIDLGDGTQAVECTLRAAIEEANATSGAVTIEFWSGFSSNNYAAFEPQSSYPYIRNNVTIAGETHPYYASRGEPGVFIDGNNAPASGIRIASEGGGTTIRHLAIGRFPNAGIYISGATGVTVEGNEIGVLSFFDVPNGRGIDVRLAENTTIIDNRITANEGSGIRITNETTGTSIYNNEIGVRSTLSGISATGNDGYGVEISSSAGDENFVGACFLDCAGNVIAGNGDGGVYLGADGQYVLANLIGTDPDGSSDPDFGNGGNGITVESSENEIGLGTEVAANVVARSGASGIHIGRGGGSPVEAKHNSVDYNYIGTNADGADLGNGDQGVRIDNGSGNTIADNVIRFAENSGLEVLSSGNTAVGNTITDNGGIGVRLMAAGTIGGVENGDGNVIGNNSSGIYVGHSSGSARIHGNYIGTNSDGDDLGNTNMGVRISNAHWVDLGNTTGEPDDGAANVIGYNGRDGVRIYQTSEVYIHGNYIGTNAAGDDLGNTRYGVSIGAGSGSEARSIRVGYDEGDTDLSNPLPEDGGLGNVIAYNGHDGVNIKANSGDPDLTGNSIRGNRMYANGYASGGVGIYLGPDGDQVDVGGDDTGPNNMQNFPEFDEAETRYNESTGEVEYRYRVRTNVDNAAYPLKIDFYLPGAGNAQGKTYLGTDVYPESNATNWRIGSFAPPSGVDVSSSDMIVATATDSDGNTSQFTPTAQKLPVELVGFEAIQQDGSIVLSWATVSETDNSGFEVQRKVKGDEAAAFETLAFIEGAGTTSKRQTYQHRVDDVEVGTYRFRLKQIDRDGTATYSDEVEVMISMIERFVFEAPYPNPARGQATLQFAVRESQPVTIVLYNTLGQRVRILYDGTPTAETTKTLTVEGAGLSSGLYFVRLSGKSFSATETVTFVK